MYPEEMPARNPEVESTSTTAEEKPETKKESAARIKDKNSAQTDSQEQINQTERLEIVGLLKDQVPGFPVDTGKAEQPPKPEISAKEKATIRKMIAGMAIARRVKDPVPEKPKSQISKKERQEIILLLKEAPDSKEKIISEEEVDYDYDHMNKQELVELLEEVVQEKDISRIKTQVARIKSAFYHRNKEEKENELQDFISGGGNKEDFKHTEDPLEQRFNTAFATYRHSKAQYAEELEKEKHHNLQLKQEILEELKDLINSEETLKKTYDEFKALQDRWKEIGMVPAGELNNLWQNYHFLVEKFFDKVRINKELRDLDLKKNLELKIELCEKAEDLLLEESNIKSFKLLQKYHDEWREIGPVPGDVKDEIWDRFKAATDKINQRRREHYQNLQEEQQRNYEAKVALCEKAEEIAAFTGDSFRDWQSRTNQINDLFKVWKTIGRAPKAKNDEIWRRFKGTLDSFFSNRREFLNKLKEQQLHNLNLKIDLCVKAEAIQDSNDWRRTSQELINLQKEWKKIGPVPRRHSDKVWKRFRAACDTFFNNKSAYFKNIHKVEAENLEAKKALLKQIEDFKVGEDKTHNLEAIKSFQHQWMEIGHVPIKEKDKLQQDYRKAIDALIAKMDINKLEVTKSAYRNRVEIIRNDPDARWKLNKERNNLQTKIKKLEEDVALWENNIGFFANSAQSEALKKEFEKKIQKARKEVDSLKAKLKILNDQ